MGNTNNSGIPYNMVGLDILLMKLDDMESKVSTKMNHLARLTYALIETCEDLESKNKALAKEVSSMKRILNRNKIPTRT